MSDVTEVKALSISRPWSHLILHHGKRIENRTWWTPYRGPLLVHAALSWQGSAVGYAEELGITGLSWDKADYPVGIVGLVDVVGICTTQMQPNKLCACGPWAMYGQMHWQLANPVPFANPVPCRGALRLWTPDDATCRAVAVEVDAVTASMRGGA